MSRQRLVVTAAIASVTFEPAMPQTVRIGAGGQVHKAVLSVTNG